MTLEGRAGTAVVTVTLYGPVDDARLQQEQRAINYRAEQLGTKPMKLPRHQLAEER